MMLANARGRSIALAASVVPFAAHAHDDTQLHMHPEMLLAPLLVAGACILLVRGARRARAEVRPPAGRRRLRRTRA